MYSPHDHFLLLSHNQISLGNHNTSLEAAKAYDTYVIENNLQHTLNGVLNE